MNQNFAQLLFLRCSSGHSNKGLSKGHLVKRGTMGINFSSVVVSGVVAIKIENPNRLII